MQAHIPNIVYEVYSHISRVVPFSTSYFMIDLTHRYCSNEEPYTIDLLAIETLLDYNIPQNLDLYTLVGYCLNHKFYTINEFKQTNPEFFI